MKHSLTEEDLLRRLQSLPRDIRPVNDGWDGIAQRIAPAPGVAPGKKAWTQPWYLAVAAGVLLTLGAGLVINLQREGARAGVPGAVALLPDAPVDADLRPAGPGPGAVSELEYRAAFREFLALGSLPVRSPTQESEPLDFGWEDTRRAEIALVDALHAEPDNLFLKERLSALRARQLELLQTIAALEMAARRNTI